MSIYVDIEKRLGGFFLKAEFEAGDEVVSLLGPSGCGKSMTLKCIAGIERPDRGRIVADGVTLFDSEKGISLPPQKRHTGLLFQNYALFPNMTVRQNLAAGARRERERSSREARIGQILERFGLTELAGHYPAQLSGGQQQRTALARILLSSPRVLLLDEPFSALDSHLRFQMEREVREMIRQFGKTVILVSHDRDEVYRMSDKIAVMDGGRIEAFGSRDAVFENPQTRSGAALTGCKNLSPIRALGGNRIYALDWKVELTAAGPADGCTYAGIRMHDVAYGPGENEIWCQVAEVVENPFSYTVMLRPADAPDAACLGWELEKAEWERVRAQTLLVHLPAKAVMPLRDGAGSGGKGAAAG